MAATLTTITNISKQVVPILVNPIAKSAANAASGVTPATAEQMSVAPGAQVTIEGRRLDKAQLERLAGFKLITFTPY